MDQDLSTEKIKKRKRSAKSIQTEATILENARMLITTHGFEATTTRDIAQAAGIAEGTLFHHFPTKVNLLAGLMGDYYARLHLVAENIFISDIHPSERLRQLLLNHLKFADAEWEIVRAFSHYGRSGETEIAEAFYQYNRGYTRLFTQVIEQLKASLAIRQTVPTPLIRDTMFGSMEHFMIGQFQRQSGYDLDQFVDQLMDLIFFGCGGNS